MLHKRLPETSITFVLQLSILIKKTDLYNIFQGCRIFISDFGSSSTDLGRHYNFLVCLFLVKIQSLAKLDHWSLNTFQKKGHYNYSVNLVDRWWNRLINNNWDIVGLSFFNPNSWWFFLLSWQDEGSILFAQTYTKKQDAIIACSNLWEGFSDDSIWQKHHLPPGPLPELNLQIFCWL